mmetsp:Transcript_145984/g.254740  ORF Transcript_145984/g.254740 Transcript_145984/m.254740 type:complete len:411 (+) Transcript_145984:73-1305(+)
MAHVLHLLTTSLMLATLVLHAGSFSAHLHHGKGGNAHSVGVSDVASFHTVTLSQKPARFLPRLPDRWRRWIDMDSVKPMQTQGGMSKVYAAVARLGDVNGTLEQVVIKEISNTHRGLQSELQISWDLGQHAELPGYLLAAYDVYPRPSEKWITHPPQSGYIMFPHMDGPVLSLVERRKALRDGLAMFPLVHPAGINISSPATHSQEVAMLAVYLGRALMELKERGVVHLDIRSDQLLARAHEHQALQSVALTDFGTAAYVDEDGSTTKAAEVVSPVSFAPELLDHTSTRHVSAQADVFGMGTVLFKAWSDAHIRRQAVNGSFTTLKSKLELDRHLSGCPRGQRQLILDALSRDPDGRPSSSEFLRRAIEVLLPEAFANCTEPDLKQVQLSLERIRLPSKFPDWVADLRRT